MPQTTHDWEWFLLPIYGDLGDGLLLFTHISRNRLGNTEQMISRNSRFKCGWFLNWTWTKFICQRQLHIFFEPPCPRFLSSSKKWLCDALWLCIVFKWGVELITQWGLQMEYTVTRIWTILGKYEFKPTIKWDIKLYMNGYDVFPMRTSYDTIRRLVAIAFAGRVCRVSGGGTGSIPVNWPWQFAKPMTDPWCYIWQHGSHQYTPVMLAYFYHNSMDPIWEMVKLTIFFRTVNQRCHGFNDQGIEWVISGLWKHQEAKGMSMVWKHFTCVYPIFVYLCGFIWFHMVSYGFIWFHMVSSDMDRFPWILQCHVKRWMCRISRIIAICDSRCPSYEV